jgi:hypothetical protein
MGNWKLGTTAAVDTRQTPSFLFLHYTHNNNNNNNNNNMKWQAIKLVSDDITTIPSRNMYLLVQKT